MDLMQDHSLVIPLLEHALYHNAVEFTNGIDQIAFL